MKNLRIGSLYIDNSFFQNEANKTIGKPGLSMEVFENRRNVTNKVNSEGKKAMTEAKEKIQKMVGDTGKVFFKWSISCGCTMCPCSPGYKVYVELNPEKEIRLSYPRHLREEERFSSWIDKKGKLDLRELKNSYRLKNMGIELIY